MNQAKQRDVVKSFQKLLRSGMDYSVSSMYQDVAKKFYMAEPGIRKIINRHYRSLVSEDMILFAETHLDVNVNDIMEFGEKFNLCPREARLMIRYAKANKNGNKRKKNESDN